jgi:glycosyltransferase involved in cell wall biosynthesis
MTLEHNTSVQIMSMYDKQSDANDNKYFPSEYFRGFNVMRWKFIFSAIKQGVKSKEVIMSHINLLVVGWMIKKISPNTKLVLFAHGIEVWNPLNKLRKIMLDACDEIISVSHFTYKKIQELHGVPAEKCKILNNCLDPFLDIPTFGKKDEALLHKYGFTNNNIILFALSRLSAKERYKGYDKVLEALANINTLHPELRYLLGGSYDEEEKLLLEALINKSGLRKKVVIAGYIPDEELSAHFNLADIYIMPSVKEGFGIVFIEAMYYGLPVIAGNKDGSVDALCNGKLGILVDPLNVNEIENAIKRILADAKRYKPDRKLLMENFSYENYKQKFEELVG